jgi:hypothetical protein
MQVVFHHAFGAFGKGATADVPDQVAYNLIKTGVAASPSPIKPILTTEAYKPSKAVRKTISKAL